MPDTFLTTGVSLGLLAGVVSGVCYLMANGLTWPRSEQKRRRCLSLGADEGVCRSCGGDTRGGLVPCVCSDYKPVKFEQGAWFLRQVQHAISLMPWSLNTEMLEQIDEECEGRESPGPSEGHAELRSVREFLETLSAKLAGGPLEGTRVAPLYHHPAYMSMFERYHPQLRDSLATLATALRDALTHLPPRYSSPSPSSASSAHPSSGASGAHAQLKRLVARVVEEAAALPALARYAAEPITPNIEASTYEDLLATAILNRVIERYQNENGSGGRSSGIHSASASPTPSERSSPRSLNSRARDISPPLREEDEISDWEEGEATVSDDTLEIPRRVPFPEFGGDIVHTTDNADRDFDEVSGSDIQAVDGSWEENWLFQKKKIKTIHSVPVPMLVPNSNADYRALIGDRDADDTTDLSDNASDAEEEAEYKSDIKRVLDSKHLIGGKSKIEEILDFEPDSLNMIEAADEFEQRNVEEEKDVVDAVNNQVNDTAQVIVEKPEDGNESILLLGIDSGPLHRAEFGLKEEIHRTLLNGSIEDYMPPLDAKMNGEIKDEMENFNKGSMSTLSRHEREGEYEETVTKPVQRYADSLRRKHFDDEPQEIPTRDTDKAEDLIPGSIAYRERKKWLNYVEMPNNPYSPEAIQKRLLAKSSSSLFDTFTKSKDLDEDNRSIRSEQITKRSESLVEERTGLPDKEINHLSKHLSVDNVAMNGDRSKSPSPRILKDVLAEEVPQFKRYGRDYYVKEAKVSSGGRKRKDEFSETSSLSSMNKSTSLDNFDSELTSPGLLIKQFNSIASNQQYATFAPKTQISESITVLPNNKTEIMIEYEDVNEQTLFSAKPAYVDDETDKKFDEILQSAYNIETDKEELKSPITPTMDNSYVSSSSLDDSIKIYNVQTGEIVKNKLDNVSLHEQVDGNDNIDMADKNILEDPLSEHSNVSEESFEIIDRDSLRQESLDRIGEIEEILPQLPSVKELAKKFVSMENLSEPIKPQPQPIRRLKSRENLFDPKQDMPKSMYMHSLTARSISKQFREELKLSMATPLTVPGGSKEIPEGEEVIKESSRPGSPLPEPGTIKSKLAFFESLKSKFSSK